MVAEEAGRGRGRGAGLDGPFGSRREGGMALTLLALCCALLGALACGDGAKQPFCIGLDCQAAPNSSACQRDSDCGDGVCGANGICRDRYTPVRNPTACANVTCQAGYFCANGTCLPATAQCKAPDPACIFIPQGSFEPPVHQWWWPWQTPQGPADTTGHAALRPDLQYPTYAQVMSTPVVLRLHPKDPSPAVVFNALSNAFNPGYVENQGVMRAISGLDGSPLWTAPADFLNNQDKSVNANSSVTAGDCMGTGEACFIAGGWDPTDAPPKTTPPKAHQHGGLVAFGSDGRFLWANRDMQVWWGGAAIARLLGPTGPAQVVVGNGVVDGATGRTLCYQTTQSASGDQIGGNGDGTLTAIADIDLDGIPEIVTANDAFKLVADTSSPTGYRCPSVFAHPVQLSGGAPCPGGFGSVCGGGFPAVASFAGYGAAIGLSPTDPHPQIVVVSRGYLRIHDWTGGMLLNPIPLPADPTCTDTNEGGAPTIADFDGDGLPEIGIAGQGAYVLYKPGKGFLWTSKTRDCSSNTGSSVFDFEGKGQAKVVYGDECYTRIFDGKTGATLIEEQNSSCTAYEMPIVADIDGTGRSKILVPANTCGATCLWGAQDPSRIFGLKALASPSDKWVNTRSVWNQHTYHVTNVNIDGTLPYPETNSWAPGASNTYRQNVQGQGVFSAPDLVGCMVTVDLTQCMAGSAVVWVTVYNAGALVVKPGVSVTVYADPGTGFFLVGTGATTRQLQPGDSEKVPVRWNNPPIGHSMNVKAVVDEKQLIGDCHPENNTAVVGPIKCSPLG